MENRHHSEAPPCASCGTALKGPFCFQCGEKQLDPAHDFSLLHFIKEGFESFTHLDSKILRSCGMLFFKPGFLTAEFIAGRRVKYFKPVPLFIIAGVLFYFFLPKTTAFYSNLNDMSRGFEAHNLISNTLHIDTESLLAQKAAAVGQSPETLWQGLSSDAAHRSKTWLFIVAPLWGLLLWLLFYRKIRWPVPHMIYALHAFTFFVLFDMVALVFMRNVFKFTQLGDLYTYFVITCFGLYNAIALRRAYQLSRLSAFFNAVWAMLAFIAVLLLFRQSMTVWTLYAS